LEVISLINVTKIVLIIIKNSVFNHELYMRNISSSQVEISILKSRLEIVFSMWERNRFFCIRNILLSNTNKICAIFGVYKKNLTFVKRKKKYLTNFTFLNVNKTRFFFLTQNKTSSCSGGATRGAGGGYGPPTLLKFFYSSNIIITSVFFISDN
jgi:hypothetical protein